jgi:hypothetical protein
MVSNRKLDCAKCGFEIDTTTTHSCPSCGFSVAGFKQADNKRKVIKAVKVGLSHPLLLLLVGAMVTALLIPVLTSLWSVNEKELDLKLQLANKIRACILEKQSISLNVARKGEIPPLPSCNEAFASIGMYYAPGSDIPMHWNRLNSATSDLTELKILLNNESKLNGPEKITGIRHAILSHIMGNLSSPDSNITPDRLLHIFARGTLDIPDSDIKDIIYAILPSVYNDSQKLMRDVINSNTGLYKHWP